MIDMKNLLLVIDMQEGFRHTASESIIPKIKKLLQDFDGDIIFACFKNERGSMFEKTLGWKKFQNKKDRRILAELNHAGAKIFFHRGYTVFTKKLAGFIKKNKFTHVYLCGVYTDVCIIKAAMDAFDNNIKVRVVHDACGSLHGENNHRFAMDSLKHIIGKNNIVPTKDVIS